MKNIKYIDKTALICNLEKYSNKQICLMVKSNAYGHGMAEIVKIATRYVEAFGVINIKEAVKVRLLTKKRVIVFAPVTEYRLCKKHDIEFIVENEEDLRKVIKANCAHLCHLAINVGMNRFGTKSEIVLKSINNILEENDIKLKSIYTHFPTTNKRKLTKKQYQKFSKLKSCISQNASVFLGGSGVWKYDFCYDTLRLGIGAYGYENGDKPVMTIFSKVIKKYYCKKGEYIGYGRKYRVTKSGFYGVVPVGYGDGLFRCLSQKFCVKINGKRYKSVGNICMDAFFVKIDKNIKVGDDVIVMDDASYIAKKARTIPYEILTSFSKLRGRTVVGARTFAQK